MNKRYKHNKNTVSLYNFHLVFCPRYRRKIFAIDGVEARFKELVHQICETNNIEVLAIGCGADYCHLFVDPPPDKSPADVMRLIKSHTTTHLRNEFETLSQCATIWTRNYFVSTEESLSLETVHKYVDSQKKRELSAKNNLESP